MIDPSLHYPLPSLTGLNFELRDRVGLPYYFLLDYIDIWEFWE